MKYITAIIGGFFIFACVFILSSFAMPLLPGFLTRPITIGAITTNNITGFVLGCVAGTASFKATLKRYRKKAQALESANDAGAPPAAALPTGPNQKSPV